MTESISPQAMWLIAAGKPLVLVRHRDGTASVAVELSVAQSTAEAQERIAQLRRDAGWYTVREAARELGVSRSMIEYLCRRGRLRDHRSGGHVLIESGSLEAEKGRRS